VYAKIVREDFLKEYGPRIIHLIGSPAYNPANGTIKLGEAEGGLKVTLFRCNYIDVKDIEMLNEYIFKTMHHEFGHILHQNKLYPKEFKLISSNFYEPFSWQRRDLKVANSLGFVSQYAGNVVADDWVEIISIYLVKTQAQWNQILVNASKEWKVKLKADGSPETTYNEYGMRVDVYEEDKDGVGDGIDGRVVIEQKLALVKKWFTDEWDADLDALREEIHTRQSNINIDSLRNQLIVNYK
jgi:substrate import-associated zinc metallohydrolase lipoprotein